MNLMEQISKSYENFNNKSNVRLSAKELMKFLDIPVSDYSNTIEPIDLYNILVDKKKLEIMVSKLRNKAFW